MTVFIDGTAVAAKVKEEAGLDVKRIIAETGIAPGLAVVLVGADPASMSYVSMKERDCEALGIRSFDNRLPAETTQEELNVLIDGLNANPDVHGILVQMPLPKHLDEEQVIERIDPAKDVDGFHPINMGKLLRGIDALRACTPWGVMRLLDEYEIDITGKHVVVIGRSNIVGKPQSIMMLERNATVTMCHSRTVDLPGIASQADVLVAAIGIPHMITKDYVKPGAVVIDIGINRVESGLTGDVDFDQVAPIASFITPVPGGVGPMTRAILMKNTVAATAATLGVEL